MKSLVSVKQDVVLVEFKVAGMNRFASLLR
jgi:hypothetical protein